MHADQQLQWGIPVYSYSYIYMYKLLKYFHDSPHEAITKNYQQIITAP